MADPPRRGWSEEHDELARTKVGVDSWAEWCRMEEERLGRTICGGRNRNDEPCGNHAGWGTDHKGIGRCRKHGGNSVRGPQHPDYKDGRYAENVFDRYLPDDWRERLEQVKTADETDVAREVLQHQVAELMELYEQRAQKQDLQAVVDEVYELSGRTLDAIEAGDAEQVSDGLRRLRRITASGVEQHELRERIHERQERVFRNTRRLKEILKDAHVLVRLDVLQARMLRFAQELRREIENTVTDPVERDEMLRKAAQALRPVLQPGEKNGGPPARRGG